MPFFLCHSVCLSVSLWLSIRLSVLPFPCLSICLPRCLSVCLSACLSVCQSLSRSVSFRIFHSLSSVVLPLRMTYASVFGSVRSLGNLLTCRQVWRRRSSSSTNNLHATLDAARRAEMITQYQNTRFHPIFSHELICKLLKFDVCARAANPKVRQS